MSSLAFLKYDQSCLVIVNILFWLYHWIFNDIDIDLNDLYIYFM